MAYKKQTHGLATRLIIKCLTWPTWRLLKLFHWWLGTACWVTQPTNGYQMKLERLEVADLPISFSPIMRDPLFYYFTGMHKHLSSWHIVAHDVHTHNRLIYIELLNGNGIKMTISHITSCYFAQYEMSEIISLYIFVNIYL